MVLCSMEQIRDVKAFPQSSLQTGQLFARTGTIVLLARFVFAVPSAGDWI
jgi:hypothetical protein